MQVFISRQKFILHTILISSYYALISTVSFSWLCRISNCRYLEDGYLCCTDLTEHNSPHSPNCKGQSISWLSVKESQMAFIKGFSKIECKINKNFLIFESCNAILVDQKYKLKRSIIASLVSTEHGQISCKK